MAKKSMIKLNIVLTLVLSQWSLCGLLVQYCKPCHIYLRALNLSHHLQEYSMCIITV